MKKKTLYISLSDFWKIEAVFLKHELNYLALSFDEIIILNLKPSVYVESYKISDFDLPNNIEIRYICPKKKYSLKITSIIQVFFKKEILIEIFRILKNNSNSKIKQLKTLIVFSFKSLELKNLLKKQFQNDNLGKVFYYSYWVDYYTYSGIILKKYFDLKVLTRGHSWDIYEFRSNINYLPIRKFIYESCDKVYPISNHAKRHITQKYSLKSNLNVKRLGVIKNNFNLKYENNIDLNILTCSYFSSVKRLHLVPQSLCLLKSFSIKWYHIGPENGAEYSKVKNITQNEFSNIGNLSYEFLDFYNNNTIDLFMNVSSFEGVSLAIMEAMSFGIPVIATNVGGTSEIVNGKNGYLINPNPNPSQIAKKLYDYYSLSNKNKLEKKKAAFETWDNKYNAEKNYTEFADDILSL